MSNITAKSALISVFSKEGLAPIVKKMNALGITIYSTGGTEKFIKDLGIDVVPVEDVTSYPSILGGRVKTLHPKVFGGILNRRGHKGDEAQLAEFDIPQIDIVIVDLYPFEKTVASDAAEQDIIEKIDIGGISLIRAGAKNYKDTLCVGTVKDYSKLLEVLESGNGTTSLDQRKEFAATCFNVSSHYDSAIYNYFAGNSEGKALKISEQHVMPLRYGENPHQRGWFYGDFDEMFIKHHGKALSYNNLLDVDAAVNLMSEFVNDAPTTIHQAYVDALAGDPVSAFGGVLISNVEIDAATAQEIHKLFCEVVIAPSFASDALEILKGKKNRIMLELVEGALSRKRDTNLNTATKLAPPAGQIEDLLFASKLCKHTKSNTIVLAKNKQLCASGTGQTSRVDALNQAIHKAQSFKFDLKGAVMASDAFFPFPDCVEIADNAGVTAIIQPGGSIKDELSIDYCNKNNIAMVFPGTRHFKH